MKKVLIIGLGSIGQRHLRNLNLINKKIKFIAYRRKKNTPTLNNNLEPNYSLKIEDLYNIKNFNSLKSSFDQRPDLAFICTPSSFHIKETIECLKKNIHVFVEKPLGSSNKNLSDLKRLYTRKKNKVITMMGYQIKFNPLFKHLRKFLNKNKDNIKKVEIFNGEHIDDFHKYEDYKISYAAKKSLGGGVLLTQIHEIDYFLDLFNKYDVEILSSELKRKTNLKLDVEDTFDGNFLLKNKYTNIPVKMHLDYYTKPKKKFIKIFYKKKIIIADFANKKFIIKKNKKSKIIFFKFENNNPFKNEVKFFLKAIKKKRISERFDLTNGIKTLEFVLQLKKLSKNSF